LYEADVGVGAESLELFAAILARVALNTGRAHSWAFAGVECAVLNGGGVCDACHKTAEGIDFFGEVAFCDAADGGVAAHLCNAVDVEGDHKGFKSALREGPYSFAAGVSAAYDDGIKLDGVIDLNHSFTDIKKKAMFREHRQSRLEG